MVAAAGVEFESADELVVDVDGSVGVVVVDAGGSVSPFDAETDPVAADAGHASTVDEDIGAAGWAGKSDTEIDGRRCGRPTLGGGLAADPAVGPLVVVVVDESVELGLEFVEISGEGLAAEPLLEGLLEAFDLAAGLGVVGAAGLGDHADGSELDFEADLEAA